jgi:hypothetical protein
MSGIGWLDAFGDELARVATAPPVRRVRRRRALAVALSAFVLLGGGAYAVPATRAALDDVAGWLAGDDGRALRPADDAPRWVREEGGRVIAEAGGFRLYVSRSGELLRFTIGDWTSHFDTAGGWRERFDRHAVVVLGTAPAAGGRLPLFGVTAESVDRVELRYESGPPLVADRVDGGFVLLADAGRERAELIAFDAAGRELERADVP